MRSPQLRPVAAALVAAVTLPLSLAVRARQLQAQNDALTEELRVQLARTASALAELQQPTERPRPSYVDSRC